MAAPVGFMLYAMSAVAMIPATPHISKDVLNYRMVVFF
jgi:hypothetical protein